MLFENYGQFMGSLKEPEKAKAVLIGVPMDFTASFRPGSRAAPQHLRQVSYGLEEYSPVLNRELAEVEFYDAGDISLPLGNVGEALRRIEEVAVDCFAAGKFPFFIGGEHLITYPIIRAAVKFFPNLQVIHLDAHADLRDEYLGEKLSHATVMRRVKEIMAATLYQAGIRSGTREEMEYARRHTVLFPEVSLEAAKEITSRIGDAPVYLTVDIDVLDPAFAPGTGTPEPGGCTVKELFTALYAFRELNIIGMDLVEVLPAVDPTERTGLLAAKIVRECLLAYVR